MTALLERLLPLWTQPADARDDAEAAFGEVYADPAVVNGTEMTLTELVDRARSLQRASDRLGMDILDIAETPDRMVIAFAGGVITAIWVVADDLGLLRQLGAARLA